MPGRRTAASVISQVGEAVGITRGGRKAEKLYRSITGADPAAKAAQGDAVLEGHLVEIKRASKSTVNQVRAVKYLPIAIHSPASDEWYVVPAHVVVAAVSEKARGQHTENPFECATLSVKKLGPWRVTDPALLRAQTLAAIDESAGHPELRDAMTDVLREARELADVHLNRIRALLHPE